MAAMKQLALLDDWKTTSHGLPSYEKQLKKHASQWPLGYASGYQIMHFKCINLD